MRNAIVISVLLFFAGGQCLAQPPASSVATAGELSDADGDTKVEVEKTTDDDTWRVKLGGLVDAYKGNYDGSKAEFTRELGVQATNWSNRSGLSSPTPGGQGNLIHATMGGVGGFQSLNATVFETTDDSTIAKNATLTWQVMTGAAAFGAPGVTPTFLPSGGFATADYKEVVYDGSATAGLILADYSTANIHGSGDVGVAVAYFGQVWPGASGSNTGLAVGFMMPGFYADGGEVGPDGTMDTTIGFHYQGHIHDDATREAGFLHDDCDFFNSLSQCTGGAIVGPNDTGDWAFLAEGDSPSRFEGVVTQAGNIGAAPAATCEAGTFWIDTDETDDSNCTTTADNSLCLCVATDTWVALENN